MKSRALQLLFASGLLLSTGAALAQDEPSAPTKGAPQVRTQMNKVKSKTTVGHEAKAAGKPEAKLVDVNRATREELKKLPGITDALADKIIAGRPYLTKSRLVTNSVIPSGTYQAIHAQITAGYVAPAKKP